MSFFDDVHREATHDWLDERDALRADERPDPSEYEDRDDDRQDGATGVLVDVCMQCGWACPHDGGDDDPNSCPRCDDRPTGVEMRIVAVYR